MPTRSGREPAVAELLTPRKPKATAGQSECSTPKLRSNENLPNEQSLLPSCFTDAALEGKAAAVTPIKRILNLDVGTPRSKQSPYSSVKSLFQCSNRPRRLVARDLECKAICDFFERSVLAKNSGSLYISGNPGTGKTAMVDQVLDDYSAQLEILQVSVVKINCMSLQETRRIYAEIASQLEINRSAGATPFEMLQKHFTCPKRKACRFTLLVLDEIDCLVEQLKSDQEILYSIFALSECTNARLAIVGIANALDLTDRLLPRLRIRDMEPELLHFSAYTVDQISEILKSRVSDAVAAGGMISSEAVELTARKVATSTDLRKALDTIRSAVDAAELEGVGVTLKHILRAFGCKGEVALSEKLAHISGLSNSAKAVLIVCSNQKERSILKHVLLHQLSLFKQRNTWLETVNMSDLDDLLGTLEAHGYVTCSYDKRSSAASMRIALCLTEQEMGRAFQSVPLLRELFV